MKFRRNNKVFSLLLPVLVTIVMCLSFLNQKQHPKTSTVLLKPTPAFNALTGSKHVTKSLAELGKMDYLNAHILFLNHIPKSGAEILILLLQKLQGFNNFKHIRLKEHKKKLKHSEQFEFVHHVFDIVRNEAVPLVFDRSLHFINFTIFDKQSPTFINIIRDPAEKITRSGKGLKCLHSNCLDGNEELTIPYFCGQDSRCSLLNNEWALNQAKMNVDKFYPVVGILEELNSTLEVFENKIPYFFKGIQKLYQSHAISKFSSSKADSKLKRRVQKLLKLESDFYGWIKMRLFQQLQILYGEHQSH